MIRSLVPAAVVLLAAACDAPTDLVESVKSERTHAWFDERAAAAGA